MLETTAFQSASWHRPIRNLQPQNKTPSRTYAADHFIQRGQVVFPSEFRNKDGLKPGEIFDVERTKAGEYIFGRKKRGSAELLEALMQFQKIAPGEKIRFFCYS